MQRRTIAAKIGEIDDGSNHTTYDNILHYNANGTTSQWLKAGKMKTPPNSHFDVIFCQFALIPTLVSDLVITLYSH